METQAAYGDLFNKAANRLSFGSFEVQLQNQWMITIGNTLYPKSGLPFVGAKRPDHGAGDS